MLTHYFLCSIYLATCFRQNINHKAKFKNTKNITTKQLSLFL
jgi:hypothetical protein